VEYIARRLEAAGFSINAENNDVVGILVRGEKP
jgi:hypothetical protein